jgi:hypothetical protein
MPKTDREKYEIALSGLILIGAGLFIAIFG